MEIEKFRKKGCACIHFRWISGGGNPCVFGVFLHVMKGAIYLRDACKETRVYFTGNMRALSGEFNISIQCFTERYLVST